MVGMADSYLTIAFVLQFSLVMSTNHLSIHAGVFTSVFSLLLDIWTVTRQHVKEECVLETNIKQIVTKQKC